MKNTRALFLSVHGESSAYFVTETAFCFSALQTICYRIVLPTTTPTLRRRMDLHHLVYIPAARLLILYKTRERIHRNEADLRLLAIPAS